ncbi:MAG: matrixin family metalloprotease [Myxococcota bacterium]
MSKVIAELWRAGVTLGVCSSMFACSASDATQDSESVAVTTKPQVSYEEFRERAVWLPSVQKWAVDGDTPIRNEEELRRYWEENYNLEGRLTVDRAGSADNIWNRTQRANLSYCISQAYFGSRYNTVVSSMQQAAAAWENVANVHFVHVNSLDGNCTNSSNVLFNVRGPAPDGFAGYAFFPDWSRSDRELLLTWQSTWDTNPRAFIGVLMHELGHVLGFRHEHSRSPTVNEDCEENLDGLRGVTRYDSLSVMHYRSCPGSTNTTGAYFMSQRDIEGAQALYEAPTNVIRTRSRLFSRRRSNGDIYRRSDSSWVRIGGPGQAFVGVIDELYGLGPGGSLVVRWSGSGTTWNSVGGSAGQILYCGPQGLCATNPDTAALWSYRNSTWTQIGGPGSKFAASDFGPYGLSPTQELLSFYNTSQRRWIQVGGPFADVITNAAFVFTLTRDRQHIQTPTLTGGVDIGGPGRQWLGTGQELYGLSVASDGVYRWEQGTTWTRIGGAFHRLYGNEGHLYGVSGNGDIWEYSGSGSTWSNLGQP